jgi:hypothetical protein
MNEANAEQCSSRWWRSPEVGEVEEENFGIAEPHIFSFIFSFPALLSDIIAPSLHGEG